MLTGVLVSMFLLVLLVAGIANARGGNDAAGARPEGDTSAVPKFVSDGGPIVDTTSGKVISTQVPRGTIVLTFDDGPDPTWTPEVLAVLKKYDVPATFFMVGANVTRYPDIVASVHAQGSELGVHSFSHPDLGTKPRWRVDRELAETQLAISGAAGVTTFLLRPPYSSSADAIDNLGWSTVAGGGRGRLRQRLHHRRQRGLAAAGHRHDHPQRHAQAGRRPRARSCSCTTRAATGPRRWPRWTSGSR